MINDLFKSFLWIILVALAAFLVYKEIRWKSKVQTLVLNNIALVITIVISYAMDAAVTIPMFGIMKSLSQ